MNMFVSNVNIVSDPPYPTLDEIILAIEGWVDQEPEDLTQAKHYVRKAFAIQGLVASPTHGPKRFTCEALNATLWEREPASFGIHSKASFNNIVSGCRRVLTRLGELDAEVALSPAWQSLKEALPTKERRMGLACFMQYCSRHNIVPEAIDAGQLDSFEVWCRTRQLKADIHGITRRTASGWNWAAEHLSGWPTVRLRRQDMREQYTLPFDQYPASFQADVTGYLDRQAADPREAMFSGGIFVKTGNSPRSRPRAAKSRTIDTKRDHIRAAGAALVLTGTPIEAITSLRDLVVPIANAAAIVQFHFKRRKAHEVGERFETRPAHLLGIIDVLRQIAKFHCRLPDDHVAAIASWKNALTPATQGQMTEKNRFRLRALLEPKTYAMLLHLPAELNRQAAGLWARAKNDSGRDDLPAPLEAARLVMYAVALEILLFCPLRRNNLVNLDIDKDLIRAGARGPILRLIVMGGDTKNGEAIDWAVPSQSSDLLRLYLRHYRPVLAEPGNSNLFPGQGLQARNAAEFGTRVAELVERNIGAEFNMHLARHFSVVRHLRLCPGEYAVVSRLLGHRKVETTVRFYAGLESDAAATKINSLLDNERVRTRQIAAVGFRGAPKRKIKAKPKAAGDSPSNGRH